MKKNLQKIKENKLRILFAILGAILTIASFDLYLHYKENIWLTIILSVLCFALGAYQVYSLYIKQKEFDLQSNIINTIFVSIIFLVVVFLLVTLVCRVMLKMPFSVEFVLYSLFLYPSIVLVTLLIMLLLLVLSYA